MIDPCPLTLSLYIKPLNDNFSTSPSIRAQLQYSNLDADTEIPISLRPIDKMRFSIFITLSALVVGTFAGKMSHLTQLAVRNVNQKTAPQYVADDTATTPNNDNTPSTTPNVSQVLDGRCTPCNDRMNECMGKWPCWFYNCQPGCTQEVCDNMPGYHC